MDLVRRRVHEFTRTRSNEEFMCIWICIGIWDIARAVITELSQIQASDKLGSTGLSKQYTEEAKNDG